MSRKEGPNSNEAIQGKLRNREKMQREQRKLDLGEIMGRPVGRRFIYDLIFSRCGLMNLYEAQDSGIYRHEGARRVGFGIAEELQQDHTDAYILMVTEHLRDQENERKLRDAALTDPTEKTDA